MFWPHSKATRASGSRMSRGRCNEGKGNFLVGGLGMLDTSETMTRKGGGGEDYDE